MLSLVLIIAMSMLTACVYGGGDKWHRDDALYLAPGVEVYPESMVVDGREYNAINSGYITNFWVTADSVPPAGYPSLSSPSRMAEALWLREMQELPDLVATAEEVWLDMALLDPREAMESLRALAPEGEIINHLYPEVASNMAWTAAAWEVYCATGSTAWLKEAYSTARRTLLARRDLLTSQGSRLLYGAPAYLYPLTPGSQAYPAWMSVTDIFQSTAAGTNVWHYAALATMARMARELNDREADRWAAEASEVKKDFNDTFWVPQWSWYGRYTYGVYYPLLSSSADNMANPLSVLMGIATTEMSRRLLKSRPSLPGGFPTVYPSAQGAMAQFSPMVQALHTIASTRVGDVEQMLRGLGPLWMAQLTENPRPMWAGAVLRGLLGVTLSAEAMTFAPMLPGQFREGLTIDSLRWRDATLRVSVRGSGSKIISFMLDSVETSVARIPSGMSGHHRIDITLSGGQPSAPAILPESSSTPLTAPETPRLQWTSGKEGNILNHDPDLTYDIYINGVLTSTAGKDFIADWDGSSTMIATLVAREGVAESFMSRPHISAAADATISIPATAITPRRPPTHLISDRATADRYIELAARHNTRITFYVNAPKAGHYYLTVDYSNGSGSTALRTVEVNGRGAGMIVCPTVALNNWVTTRPSSVLTVNLDEGVNKISLTYAGTTMLLNRINLLRK